MKILSYDARLIWRTWSMWLTAFGTALLSLLTLAPDWALVIWAQLPEEFKAAIPPQYMPMISVVFFVLAMVARFIKQRKVDREQAELAIRRARDEAQGEPAIEPPKP